MMFQKNIEYVILKSSTWWITVTLIVVIFLQMKKSLFTSFWRGFRSSLGSSFFLMLHRKQQLWRLNFYQRNESFTFKKATLVTCCRKLSVAWILDELDVSFESFNICLYTRCLPPSCQINRQDKEHCNLLENILKYPIAWSLGNINVTPASSKICGGWKFLWLFRFYSYCSGFNYEPYLLLTYHPFTLPKHRLSNNWRKRELSLRLTAPMNTVDSQVIQSWKDFRPQPR